MQVSIISTSDVHGYFRADDFRRPLQNDGLGLTRAATVIETLLQKMSSLQLKTVILFKGHH